MEDKIIITYENAKEYLEKINTSIYSDIQVGLFVTSNEEYFNKLVDSEWQNIDDYMEETHEYSRVEFFEPVKGFYFEYIHRFTIIYDTLLSVLPEHYTLSFNTFIQIINDEEVKIYHRM